jgi:gingipain R
VASLVLADGKRGAKDFDLTVTEDTTGSGRISARIKAKRAFSVGLTQRQNKEYQTVPFESCLPTKEKGFPEVSYFRMVFQLRNNQSYKLVVQNLAFDELPYEGEWLPSRGQILRSVDPATVPYKMDNAALVDTDYPGSEFVVLGDPFLIREVRGIDLTIYPVLINTVLKRVKILKSIEFELVPVEEGIAVNQQPRGRLKILSQDKPVLESLFANFRWTGELDDGPGHMLVIYTADYKTAIQPFIAHKESLGFTVAEQEVAKRTHVKSTIQNAYNADPDLLYVQLVGDWGDIRCDTVEGGPADNALGLVAGSDNYYDLIISRFSVGSAADVTTHVNKVITYETNSNQDWWKRGLGIASNEGPGDDGETDKEHVEIIKVYKLLPHGYTTVYDEYDPGASASGVTSVVNGGVHVINYTGHGSETAWGTTGYSINDVYALSNGDKLPIIFSTACVVGLYSFWEECFAEAWLRKQNGGAVSVLMATIYQPWDPPMRGQDYMNDLLTGGYDYATNPGAGISTSHGKTRVGSIAFNAFNLQIAEAGQGDVNTTKTWVLFGDGSLQVVGGSSCPDCSGDEKVLKNITFKANTTCTCTGTTSLTLEGVTVESGASVTFQAPLVRVTSGVRMEEGSKVEIRK